MKQVFYTVWTLSSFTLVTSFFAFAAVVVGLIDRTGRTVNMCAREWARVLLTLNGVRLNIHGHEHVSGNRSYIFMANHQSALDIPVLFAALPFQLRMMAKKELFRIPVFGWALSLGGYIRVDRENRERAIASLQQAAKRVQRQRVSVVVFPEGTRSGSGQLGTFKKGGFMFALDTGYPVVPVTLDGARDRTPNRQLIITPGEVDVYIGKPISVTKYTRATRDELIARTAHGINKHLNGGI